VDTTRGRANVLREFLTLDKKDMLLIIREIQEAMGTLLSIAKGCTSECPSNVDMEV